MAVVSYLNRSFHATFIQYLKRSWYAIPVVFTAQYLRHSIRNQSESNLSHLKLISMFRNYNLIMSNWLNLSDKLNFTDYEIVARETQHTIGIFLLASWEMKNKTITERWIDGICSVILYIKKSPFATSWSIKCKKK